MTKTLGGPVKPVKFIYSNDLKENGGDFALLGGPAVPIKVITQDNNVQGGPLTPMYPLTASDIQNMGRKVIGGPAIPVYAAEDLGYVAAILASGSMVQGSTYVQKILGMQSNNLIAYWPLSEGSGTTTPAPAFDGSSDYVDVYSASLASVFNGAEGTVSIWIKVSGSGAWADGAFRRAIILRENNNNRVAIYKDTVNNTVRWLYTAGGTASTIVKAGVTTTSWINLAITWSKSADEVKMYFNGSQEGSTQTGLGTYVGDLVSGQTFIGADSTTPTLVWDGWLAHAAVWDTPLSAAQIANIYNNQSNQKATVLATSAANLIGYWPMDETSGSTADNAEGTADRDGTYTGVALAAASFSASYTADNAEGTSARDGTYSGVTLANDNAGGFGTPAPLFDGANDYCDVYSANMAGAINGSEGTLALWLKVKAASVWTDSTFRAAIALYDTLTQNLFLIQKLQTPNQIQFVYLANNVNRNVTISPISDTGWVHAAMTWSASADEFKAYHNGSQTGATQTGLGTWTGTADSTRYNIGCRNNTIPDRVWNGYLAHVAIWDTPLSAAQIAELATV